MANKADIKPKSYSSTYLYNKYHEYEKNIFMFMKSAVPVDKTDDTFDDIRYEVKKRQVSSSLVQILDSSKIVLMIDAESLPKPFKVFAAKDDSQGLKVYIDCTDIIMNDNGYSCRKIDILISRLVSAGIYLIYYADPERFVNNTNLSSFGAAAFSSLFTYILDYEFKIGTIPGARDKAIYLSAMYYLVNILGKEINSSTVAGIPKKLAGFSEREEEILKLSLTNRSFNNIKEFVSTCADALRLPKLNTELVVQRWMYVYGNGTVFALEMFPAFATMMSDAYVGAYINNQKTIEKVARDNMVGFTKRVLAIEDDSV